MLGYPSFTYAIPDITSTHLPFHYFGFVPLAPHTFYLLLGKGTE